MNNFPDFGQYPPLDANEQERLLQEFAETQSSRIKEKIFNHNLGLVAKVATKCNMKQGGTKEDLFQEGCLGLLRAIEKFDPETGLKFSTYAYHWIRAKMLRYVSNNSHVFKVNMSPEKKKVFWKLSKTMTKLKAEGKDITPHTVAEELGVKPSDAKIMMEVSSAYIYSLDIAPTEDSAERGFTDEDRADIEFDYRTDELVDRKSKAEAYNRLAQAFCQTLKRDSQKFVFKHRFMEEVPWTYQKIQEHIGGTRQNWSQISLKLEPKFKQFLIANGVTP